MGYTPIHPHTHVIMIKNTFTRLSSYKKIRNYGFYTYKVIVIYANNYTQVRLNTHLYLHKSVHMLIHLHIYTRTCQKTKEDTPSFINRSNTIKTKQNVIALEIMSIFVY